MRDIRFNEERARALFTVLTERWIRKQGIFRDITLPESRYELPRDPRQAANWFFFASLTQRGGVVSEDPFKWLWQLSQQYPEMYEPAKVVSDWSPAKIAEAFKAIAPKNGNGNGNGHKQATFWTSSELAFQARPRIRKANEGKVFYKLDEHANSWYQNACALGSAWGSDLRNVFWGVTEFEEAFRRIDYKRAAAGVAFVGMRRKIFSLLTIWLQEKQLIPQFPGPIPVDFHAMRVLMATGVVEGNIFKPFIPHKPEQQCLAGKLAVRVTESLMDAIAKWSQRFLAANGFSHMVINPALWVLSRELCVNQLQNGVKEGLDRSLILIDPEELRKDLSLWPEGYLDSCSHCPAESLCTGTLPAGPYYRWGALVRSTRVSYPYERLGGRFLPGVDRKDVLPLAARKDQRA